MSATTVRRIFADTESRLLAAHTDDEVRAIVLDYSTKLGADLAETMFLRIRELSPLTDPEINSMILQGAEGVTRIVTDTFATRGPPLSELRDAYGAATLDGYLDRLEALLTAPETRGRA